MLRLTRIYKSDVLTTIHSVRTLGVLCLIALALSKTSMYLIALLLKIVLDVVTEVVPEESFERPRFVSRISLEHLLVIGGQTPL